jgi:signal transduction histidine kinase
VSTDPPNDSEVTGRDPWRWVLYYRPALLVLAVGLAALGVLLAAALNMHERRAAAHLASDAHILVGSIEGALSDNLDRLTSLQGLFEASDVVTRKEFQAFAVRIGPAQGMARVGFAPLVSGVDLPSHLAEIRLEVPTYQVYRLGPEGEPRAVGAAPSYFPVLFSVGFSDLPDVLGLSLTDDREAGRAISEARTGGGPSLTNFVSLAGDDTSGDVLLFVPAQDKQGRFIGMLLDAVQVDELVEETYPALLDGPVEWTMTDVTGSGDHQDAVRRPTAWADTIDIFDRRWRLEVVAPVDHLQSEKTGYVLALWLGLLATVLAALAAHLFNQRTAHRLELARLNQLSQEKDRFLAAVSHELRTPLTAVLGMAGILADEGPALPEAELRELVHILEQEANELADLVEDLLTSERVKAGSLNVFPAEVDLGEEIGRVVGRLAIPPGKDMVVAEHLGKVWADPLRVRQIARNLCANAVRYATGRVIIEAEQAGHELALSVRNDGPPIPDWREKLIFQPYEGRDVTGRQPDSIGLGLSISLQLARAMGGTLAYARREEWTVFTLTLPAAPKLSFSAEGGRRDTVPTPSPLP